MRLIRCFVKHDIAYLSYSETNSILTLILSFSIQLHTFHWKLHKHRCCRNAILREKETNQINNHKLKLLSLIER